MKHYIEIKLLPDPEFAPTLLMNALYVKLHRIFVELKCNNIGVSFPDYDAEKPSLGQRLRLHGSDTRLQELVSTNWDTGMRDHLFVSNIYESPDNAKYAVFSRVQTKSNVERIRRRQMKRHSLSYEEACEKIPDTVKQKSSLPFITMKSSSTGQLFRMFIKQKTLNAPVQNCFNTYGLSRDATVPLF